MIIMGSTCFGYVRSFWRIYIFCEFYFVMQRFLTKRPTMRMGWFPQTPLFEWHGCCCCGWRFFRYLRQLLSCSSSLIPAHAMILSRRPGLRKRPHPFQLPPKDEQNYIPEFFIDPFCIQLLSNHIVYFCHFLLFWFALHLLTSRGLTTVLPLDNTQI